MRLETGLAHFNQDLVYDPKKTTYVWSPYAMTHAWLMRDMLSDRLKAFQVSLFYFRIVFISVWAIVLTWFFN